MPSCCRRVCVLLSSLLLTLSLAACNDEGTVVVKSLQFKGVHAVDSATLKSVLATREATKIPLLGIRPPWLKPRRYFDRGRFDADLLRIQAFYSDRGYPDARVTSFDVKLNDRQDAVDVALTIVEGEPVRVVAVNLTGFEALPPDHLAALQQRLPIRTGRPRDRQEVVSAHEAALNELRDHGYPYARVATSEDDGVNGKSATITFVAVPGLLARFGPVEISGNRSVGEAILRRQLTVKEGDLYRRSVVQETQRRLYAMELFQFVNVEPTGLEEQRSEVPMRVTVAEERHQRINAGIGYGTEEQGRVDGEYRHVNFLGGARALGAHARYSSRDRGLRFDFTQPYVWTSALSVGAEGRRWYAYTPAYNSVVSGGRLSLTHRRGARTAMTVSIATERNVSTIADQVLGDPDLYNDLISLGLDPTTGKQQGTLSAVGFDLQHARTDDALDPRRGYHIGVHLDQAGRLLPGTFNYWALTADLRAYVPIGRAVVVANRFQFGDIRPASADPTQVPFAKKYFLGGATSLRGWGRYEVSPLSTSGLPIGGTAMVAISSEVRATVTGKLGGVLFVDAGNVWKDDGAIELASLRASVGSGIRYPTPVGPLRLDIGYQLTPIDGLVVAGTPQLRRWRIHFSIGQAY